MAAKDNLSQRVHRKGKQLITITNKNKTAPDDEDEKAVIQREAVRKLTKIHPELSVLEMKQKRPLKAVMHCEYPASKRPAPL